MVYAGCTHQGELCLRQLVSSPSLSDLVREQKSQLCEHTLIVIYTSACCVNCIFFFKYLSSHFYRLPQTSQEDVLPLHFLQGQRRRDMYTHLHISSIMTAVTVKLKTRAFTNE